MSQVEAAVYSLSPWVADYDVNGHIAARVRGTGPSASSPTAPSRAPATTAGWRWPAGTTTTGARLARVIGVDEATTARLATLDARRAAVDEIEALVSAWTATRKRRRCGRDAAGGGSRVGPVADLGDASADAQLAHRGHFVTLTHPCMGACGYERNGFRLSDAPAGYERTSPTLGEHNEMVLGEILGLDGAERSRLTDAGVLE